MKLKLATALFLVMLIGINSADAQVRARQRHEQARIRQGVRNGELTHAEAANVRRDNREIKQEIHQAKSDGVVTHAERKEIRQDERQLNRKIYRKKHNRRDRN
jgi:uncharacterized membrane protein YebE (DUF533 family)